MRLTGEVSRISMDRFMRKFKLLLKENLVKVYLIQKYVDDINMMLEKLGKGTRWEKGSLRWKQEWEDEDHRSGKTGDRLTMEQILNMISRSKGTRKLKLELANVQFVRRTTLTKANGPPLAPGHLTDLLIVRSLMT